ncbi:hypothetical protein [Stackebrandtia albiflava]|uniref:hypothetical protein n=1 Tax=Stackebrandtia albiflava TaxID=406432 RepID=UPI0011BD7674|nr:hypothetical protein [Stackebrandtia albiflava]
MYAHRFLPGGRDRSGDPVFSVWGIDTIYYGTDLADYVGREFGATEGVIGETSRVSFWCDLIG